MKKTEFQGDIEPPKYNRFMSCADMIADKSQHHTYTILLYGDNENDCTEWHDINTALVKHLTEKPDTAIFDSWIFCGMYHNRDPNSKLHWHLIFQSDLGSKLTYCKFWEKICIYCGLPIDTYKNNGIWRFLQVCDYQSMLLYVTHIKYPHKVQYHPKELQGHATMKADCLSLWLKEVEKQKQKAKKNISMVDLMPFINEFKPDNIYQLMELLILNNKIDLVGYVSNHPYLIVHLLKYIDEEIL